MKCDGQCSFDPFSAEYDRDPHPTHAHLREEHRVYRWPRMKAWVLSHHADVDWLLKSAPVGTSDVHWRDAASEPASESTSDANSQDTSWDWLRRETLTFKEGSEHARLRRYVSRTFTPAAVRRLAPRLRELVSTLLEEAERGGDDFDLARDLSSRVPIQILGWLVGVPSEMEADFCRYAVQLQNVINPLADEAARREADAAANGFQKMIDEIIARAEMHPSEELLSALVHHDDGEGRLDRTSLLGIITAIIMAGAETTGSLVNHGMLALLRHPDQLTRLRAEPALLPTAIEELGRFEFPTKFVTRYPLEDLEIAGQRIEAGELVFASPGAANRDPAVFDEPDRLDISRPAGAALTFGAGAHYCLGASLARLEAQEMIGQLIGRFASIEQSGEPVFSPHFNIRLISSLPLRLGRSRPGRRAKA